MQKLLTRFLKHPFSDIRKRILDERQSRLTNDPSTLPVNSTSKLSAFRNVCTIAHIDAGKTTLTERLLYGCGAIGDLGEVHDGTALMDFTEEERKRGITINSACITFMWKNVHVNLIDTPGHADFNFEVERSLKILDGALVIIDAVKGVEAQTRMVWKQANKYNVAKLIVVNKMDKQGADYVKCLQNIETTLNVKVFPALFPVFQQGEFIGIADIFGKQYYSWAPYPSLTKPVLINDSNINSLKYYKAKLILGDLSNDVNRQYFTCLDTIVDYLSERNEQWAEAYLSAISDDGKSVNESFLQKVELTIKQLLLDHPDKYSLSLPASALKNKGIYTVLDSIIEYLPAPVEILSHNVHPLLFVFKRVLDQEYGILAFAKVITGKLLKNANLLNLTNNSESKISKIYRIQANEFAEMDEATSGDIVALVGLKSFSAGDNLLLPTFQKQLEGVLVKGFELREPVFHVSIDFKNTAEKEGFLKIIDTYVLEDPSISFKLDKQTGQYIISGQGELHIETKFNRIFTEHGIRAAQGRVNVTFMEIATKKVDLNFVFERKMKGAFKYLELELNLSPIPFIDCDAPVDPIVELDIFTLSPYAKTLYQEYISLIDELSQAKSHKIAENAEKGFVDSPEKTPKKGIKSPKKEELVHTKVTRLSFLTNPVKDKPEQVDFAFSEDISDEVFHISNLSFELLYSIQTTLKELMIKGPITCSPLINTKLTITGGRFNNKYLDPVAVKIASIDAFSAIVKPENCGLLEPMVEVQITTRNDSVNDIISNAVSIRKGKMGNIITAGKLETEFTVNIPLLSSVNYAAYLRSVTNGDVKLSMKNHGYAKTLFERQEFICKNYQ